MSILRMAHSRCVTILWAGFLGKTQKMQVHGQRSLRSFCYGLFNSIIAYAYCISSNNSAIVLLYQELPTSLQCGEAIARRRQEEGRAGSASRGLVSRWGRFSSRVRHRHVPERDKLFDRCNTSGSAASF